MKSPYQVKYTFNPDLNSDRGSMVWSLSRVDGRPLSDDGFVAYNFDSEEEAVKALQVLSRRFYSL